jgi:hypothetical protein
MTNHYQNGLVLLALLLVVVEEQLVLQELGQSIQLVFIQQKVLVLEQHQQKQEYLYMLLVMQKLMVVFQLQEQLHMMM